MFLTTRIICLSIPPFLVVHTNLAFAEFTGIPSNEILGRRLHHCLGKTYEREFLNSVTTMHDRLVPIAIKAEDDEESCLCFVRVALVGPDMSDIAQCEDGGIDQQDDSNSTWEDDTAFFVTHYCVELEPVSSGQNSFISTNGIPRRTVVSPRSTSSGFCGVLG